MTTVTPTIGLCPSCEGEIPVRINGTVRKHTGPNEPTCSGSGRTAAAVLPLTFRRWLATQTNRRGHGTDLFIGRLARTAERYGDDWVTAEDLADAMGVSGVDPDAAIVRYLADASNEYDADLRERSKTGPSLPAA